LNTCHRRSQTAIASTTGPTLGNKYLDDLAKSLPTYPKRHHQMFLTVALRTFTRLFDHHLVKTKSSILIVEVSLLIDNFVAKLWPEKTDTARHIGPTNRNETGNGQNSSLAATSLIVND
jgi:hypothetical protein